jgi:hypothetical protein
MKDRPNYSALKPGMEILEGRALPSNLIVNGDFEAGDTGFQTEYRRISLLFPQSYDVLSDPHLGHGAAASYGDHTSGSGLMMVVNGAEVPDVTVWSQTVPVSPGIDYSFSSWVSSWTGEAVSPTLQAQLEFLINGNSLGVFPAPTDAGVWQQFTATWNSGSAASAQITIIDLNSNIPVLNDFALDDLSLTGAKPDLAATTPVLNKDQGVNFSYSVSGANLSVAPTLGLYWSTDVKYDKSDAAAFTVGTPQMAQGTYPVHVLHNQLSAPPAGTQYLLAVINPDVSIRESDNPSPDDVNQDENNVQPLLLQSSLTIVSPAQGNIIYMTSADGRTATVPLQIAVTGFVTGDLTWKKLDIHYVSPVTGTVFDKSNPGDKAPSADPFVYIEKPYGYDITGKGGTLTIQASVTINGTQVDSDPITVGVRGYQTVPKDTIRGTLKSLYGPLFVGIADLESKYWTEGKGQFNLDGTPYITSNIAVGLTQIYVKRWADAPQFYDDIATYWDWQVNASRGANIFQIFRGVVDRRVDAIRKRWGNKLPNLSQAEREDWAMGLYSGELHGKDFYIPNATHRKWVINPNLPAGARAYVNRARERAYQITGDSSVLVGKI